MYVNCPLQLLAYGWGSKDDASDRNPIFSLIRRRSHWLMQVGRRVGWLRMEGGEWAPGPPGPEQEVEVTRTHFQTLSLSLCCLLISVCLSPSFPLCLASFAHCHLMAETVAAEVQIQICSTPPKTNKTSLFSQLSNISTTGVLWLVQCRSCHRSVYPLTSLWWLIVHRDLCSLFQITELCLGGGSPDKDVLSQPHLHPDAAISYIALS